MARFLHLGGVHREFHHLKVVDPDDKSGKPKFERAMMIYKPTLKGKSFWVPDSCGWKYLDPKDNADVHVQDSNDFADLLRDMAHAKKMRPFGDFTDEFAALTMASSLYVQEKFLRCTTYSLVKCLQLLDIPVNKPAIFQLLMFIQDGLRELQRMNLPIPETETETGLDMKMTFHRDDDVKVIEAPLTIKEGELKTGMAL